MISKAISKVAECAASLGLDAAKERAKDKLNERKLRADLKSYVERQQKINEMCSIAEEIDYQGLLEYIQNNLIEKAGIRIFEPDRKKRGQARQEIVDAVVAYSKANTSRAKKRVSSFISTCLDIIHNFYKDHHLSVKDYLLADMIVDTVSNDIHELHTDMVKTVDEAKKQILAKIDNTGSLFSFDRAVSLAEAGEVDIIQSDVKKMIDHITVVHPYYPDFGYDYKDGRVFSKPLTVEAEKQYPPKVILTGAIRFGDQYYNDFNVDPLDYAYRHQLPITMEVSKATKMLGEKLDPRQNEVNALEGSTVVVTPPKFPPAFPCAIKVGEHTFFEYVLLRTYEIMDDGTYVINNKEQDGCFYFEVRVNPKNPSKINFKINITNATNKKLLNYLRFISTLYKVKTLHIYVLSLGEDIIAGYVNENDDKTNISSVDEEIDFLERVCAIESYFGITLAVRGEVSNKEYETVLHISNLIRNEKVMGTWKDATFTGIMSQHFRKELISMDKELYMFSYVGTSHVNLFGADIKFRFMRTFKCAYIVDFEKVKQKAEILDDGDDIKITFRAGDDNGTIDTIKIPEEIESAFNF